MKRKSKEIMGYLKKIHGDEKKAEKWLESQTSSFTFKKFSEMKDDEIINELSFAGHLLSK